MSAINEDENIDELLDKLERAVFQRRTQEGVQLLLRLLAAMNVQRSPFGVLPPPSTPEERRAVYTRIAAMISALLCSPDFLINLEQINFLVGRKPMLEAIFELSGYEGPFHLLRYNGVRNADGSVLLKSQQVLVLSLFYSLDSLPAELLEGVLRLPPDQLLPLMVGWFAAPFVHHTRGEANRAKLIEHCAKIETAKPSPGLVQAMCAAWMHCSYADHPQKHHVKRSLNEVWKRLNQSCGLKSRNAPRRLVERPTLLVAAERMQSGHAMHRCYAAALSELRQRFRTVCMVAEGFITDDALQLFDEVQVLETSIDVKDIGARIVKIAPDVIYYPSLGMSEWTQMIANLRYAPIQLMTFGHPAPAMTDTIDYTIAAAGGGATAWEFGRKVIERKAYGQYVPHADLDQVDLKPNPFEDGRLHIAVNSSLMKLSPRFLALCERIEAEARRPVHFHFFASASGVMYDRLSQVFERRFRYFTLEPSRNYGAFLKQLNRCEMALSAFPFGNTNSTIDTCLLAIPNVAYWANEPLSHFDRDVMELVGLPKWLVTESDEEYFQTAMKLIHDDAARQAVVDQLKTTDVKSALFGRDVESGSEFVEAIDWIYRNHEALQASPQHLLRVGDPIAA